MVCGYTATNVLVNAGFETGASGGWTTYGSHAVESTNDVYYNGGIVAGASNVLTHSGRFAGKAWGGFTGSYNANGFFQDAVAGPGSVWSASGFAFTHQQDLMQAGNQFWYEVTFRDATDIILGMYRSAILDPAMAEGVPTNQWVFLSVTNEHDIADPTYQTITNTRPGFTAPAGTAKVRFQAVYAQLSGYPGGSIYMDDLNLTKVAGSDPDITASPEAIARVEGQTARFTVAAVGGSTLSYRWQKDATDLANDMRISGVNSSTLTISNVTTSDAGRYTAIVSDAAGQATSAAALLTVVTEAQAANVLQNPGFESGADAPWQKFNGGAMVTSISDPAGMLEGSGYARQTWGGGVWNGIYQDVPASAGQAFQSEGSFLVSEADPITGRSEAWLEVQFLDAGGNLVGLYQSAHISSNTTASAWMRLEATNVIAFWGDYSVAGNAKYLVAPAGTAKVRYQVTYHALDGAGSVYFDNMSLDLKAPVRMTAKRVGNSIELSFPAQVGVNYEVLYKTNLTDATWQVLTTVKGSLAGQASVTDAIGAAAKYYRVNTL